MSEQAQVGASRPRWLADRSPGPWLRYGAAVASVLVATIARLLLHPTLGHLYPFGTLYVTVTFTAWYGGLGPALLALVLGTLAAAFFFIAPTPSFSIGDEANLVGLALYLFVGLTAAFLSESLRAARRRAEESAQEAKEKQGELEQEIEERRRAEAAQAELLERLAAGDREKDMFLAMLGHELRTPLGAVHTSLFLLQRRAAGNPEIDPLRERMERQVRRMARLIDDLQDISRISRGKISLQLEVVDLIPLVRETVEDHRGAFVNRGLALTLEAGDGPIRVEGDPTRLAQILTNLLNNAAKFTDPGGKVHVCLTLEREWAVIRVQDTGIGIDPAVLPRVFESFTQAEGSLDRTRGGLGLGLALVKGLVEAHRGTVSATSRGAGQGAEFTLRLPLCTDEIAPSVAG